MMDDEQDAAVPPVNQQSDSDAAIVTAALAASTRPGIDGEHGETDDKAQAAAMAQSAFMDEGQHGTAIAAPTNVTTTTTTATTTSSKTTALEPLPQVGAVSTGIHRRRSSMSNIPHTGIQTDARRRIGKTPPLPSRTLTGAAPTTTAIGHGHAAKRKQRQSVIVASLRRTNKMSRVACGAGTGALGTAATAAAATAGADAAATTSTDKVDMMVTAKMPARFHLGARHRVASEEGARRALVTALVSNAAYAEAAWPRFSSSSLACIDLSPKLQLEQPQQQLQTRAEKAGRESNKLPITVCKLREGDTLFVAGRLYSFCAVLLDGSMSLTCALEEEDKQLLAEAAGKSGSGWEDDDAAQDATYFAHTTVSVGTILNANAFLAQPARASSRSKFSATVTENDTLVAIVHFEDLLALSGDLVKPWLIALHLAADQFTECYSAHRRQTLRERIRDVAALQSTAKISFHHRNQRDMQRRQAESDRARIDKLTIERLRAAKEKVDRSFAVSRAKGDSLRDKNEKLEQQQLEYWEQMKHQEETIEHTQNDLENAKKEAHDMAAQCQSHVGVIAKLREHITGLEASVADLEKRLLESEETRARDKRRYHTDVEGYRKLLRKDEVRAGLEMKLASDDIEKIREQMKQREVHIMELRAHVDELDFKLESSQADIARVLRANVELKGECNLFKREISGLNVKLEEAAGEKKRLKEYIQDLEHFRDGWEGQLAGMRLNWQEEKRCKHKMARNALSYSRILRLVTVTTWLKMHKLKTSLSRSAEIVASFYEKALEVDREHRLRGETDAEGLFPVQHHDAHAQFLAETMGISRSTRLRRAAASADIDNTKHMVSAAVDEGSAPSTMSQNRAAVQFRQQRRKLSVVQRAEMVQTYFERFHQIFMSICDKLGKYRELSRSFATQCTDMRAELKSAEAKIASLRSGEKRLEARVEHFYKLSRSELELVAEKEAELLRIDALRRGGRRPAPKDAEAVSRTVIETVESQDRTVVVEDISTVKPNLGTKRKPPKKRKSHEKEKVDAGGGHARANKRLGGVPLDDASRVDGRDDVRAILAKIDPSLPRDDAKFSRGARTPGVRMIPGLPPVSRGGDAVRASFSTARQRAQPTLAFDPARRDGRRKNTALPREGTAFSEWPVGKELKSSRDLYESRPNDRLALQLTFTQMMLQKRRGKTPTIS